MNLALMVTVKILKSVMKVKLIKVYLLCHYYKSSFITVYLFQNTEGKFCSESREGF